MDIQRSVTLRDVAQLAGVCVSTVSRILNTPAGGFGTAAVRESVWSAAAELHYIPNQQARLLKQGKSPPAANTGKALAIIQARTVRLSDNPFFAQAARAVESEAMNAGLVISSSYSIVRRGKPDNPIQTKSLPADAAVVLGRFNPDAQSTLAKQYEHIIYIGRNVCDALWDQVICDGYEATTAAISYLASRGHRRIAYIGEKAREVRYQAYADAVRKLRLDNDAELVTSCQQNGEDGYDAVGKLLLRCHPQPTAVFCATDVTALSAMKRLAQEGIHIPRDISVMGMDDIESSSDATPMLTTIVIPVMEMGREAVRMLLDRMSRGHRLPMKLFLPSRLAIRGSVGDAPKVR